MCNGRLRVLFIFLLLASFLAPSISSAQEKNSTHLYPVLVNGKWGYINLQGKIVIKPRFFDATDFSNGVSFVQTKDNWAVLNESGKTVISNLMEYHPHCFGGPLPVQFAKNKKFGFIDQSGRTVIEPRFNYARCFSEGLAAVRTDTGWGFVDKSGGFAIQPKYSPNSDYYDWPSFSEG
jgi:hypothetical protein